MKKSCIVLLSLFVLVAVGYYFVLHRYTTWQISLILAVFGAFSVLLIYSGFRQLLMTGKKMRAIQGALSGKSWSDGELAAGIGAVRPETQTLQSPIFGRDCVLYEYNVYRDIKPLDGKKPLRDHVYSGVAMVPFVIQGSLGKVRLLGFPDLQHFPEKKSSSMEDVTRFNAYAGKTQFEEMRGLGKFKLISELENIIEDTDGMIRKNWRMNEIPESSTGIRVAEKAVLVGETVVAFGKFSSDKQAIVTELGAFGMMIELYSGTPQTVP